MQETPKENGCDASDGNDKKPGAQVEDEEKRRSYYYDDAHGYQDFDPANSDDEDDGDLAANTLHP